jgi:hypothetical protein
LKGAAEIERFLAIGGFAHHLEVWLAGQQGQEAGTHQDMIVDDDQSSAGYLG